MTEYVSLVGLVDEVTDLLREQLEADELRWKDTWRHRSRKGQEDRAFARFQDYKDQYQRADVPVPWLKIMGECVIAIVRERHPELLIE